jgi:hypothetical protein
VSSDGNDVPGPGAYQPEIRSSKRLGPSYTIGRGKRPKLTLIDENVPGPGKYLAVYNQTSTNFTDGPNKTATTFGLSKRAALAFDTGTPGPIYEVLPRNNSAPKFSFFGKKAAKLRKDDFRFPGPGQYFTSHNFMVGKDGPAHLIGTQKRFMPSKTDAFPGPGKYEMTGDVGNRGPKMAKGLRRGLATVDADIEVGPGTYEIKSTVP